MEGAGEEQIVGKAGGKRVEGQWRLSLRKLMRGRLKPERDGGMKAASLHTER